ncbi:MAG: glycosyltransferase family 2 protein [Actinomycetales bacterium]|nr:glycosyltransferase family 2 protein [Actinomycetales bacterium]
MERQQEAQPRAAHEPAAHPAQPTSGQADDGAAEPAATNPEAHHISVVNDRTPVSVVMPVLNEALHLKAAVAAVLAQDWPAGLEVVLAVGPSRDGTEDVAAQLAATDPRVVVVANPSGSTPDALNAAIAATSHPVVVRVDAHSELPAGYIATAVATLARTGADNVGGIMWPEGRNDFERAVAVAMTSPVGVGAASYHTGGAEGPCESVYLGSFRKSALQRVGGYDPRFTRAQDWEMNHRIIDSGGLVWFTPEMRVIYRPRPTLRALASQYFQYGQWRRVVMRQHSGTILRPSAARYLAPPALVLGLGCSVVAGVLRLSGAVGDAGVLPRVVDLLIAVPAVYAVAVVTASAVIGRRLNARSLLWLPVIIATMHTAWGCGFIRGARLRSER